MSILVDLFSCVRDKENMATRGLEAVLNQPDTLSGLNTFLNAQFNWALKIHGIRAQVNQGENGQPDLQGKDVNGQTIFFGEVKFGASLTSNQPKSYLNALPPGGLLLFIAPRYRRDILWRELLQALGGKPESDGTYQVLVNGKYLALVTGSDLLQALSEAARTPETLCDVRHLQDLWEEYDTPELPPIDPGTCTNQGLAKIISGFCKLPAKIAGAASLLRDTECGKRAGNKSGCTYTELRIGQLNGWVIYSPSNWERYGKSPIWFETRKLWAPGNALIWQAIRASFAQFAGQEPFVSVSDPNFKDVIAVPLTILPNDTESAVVDNILKRLSGLADGIANYPSQT
jgi:hypothetical protein